MLVIACESDCCESSRTSCCVTTDIGVLLFLFRTSQYSTRL